MATPLAAISAVGLGPLTSRVLGRDGEVDVWIGAESCGVVARQLLEVITAHGGRISDGQLRFQTADAELAVIAEALGRMLDGGLVTMSADGTVRLTPALSDGMSMPPSLADHQAVNSDELRLMCLALDLKPPARKGERIAAIAGHFAGPEGRERVLNRLSRSARSLLERLVEQGAARPVPADRVDVDPYLLHLLARVRRSSGAGQSRQSALAALAPLVDRGIVGYSAWEGTLWIWQEAIPVLDVPLHREWEPAPRPGTGGCRPAPARLAPIVAVADRALALWAEAPPKVLKNDESRLPRPAVRSTARSLAVDEGLVELAANLLIDIGLILPNVVSSSGRGRRRTVDRAWMPDPLLWRAWRERPTAARWARLVAAWARPTQVGHHQQLLSNRHLVLWEMGGLDPGTGFDGDEALARWIGDRYASVGLSDAVTEVLGELRALALVPADGPVGLTDQARQVLADPGRAESVVTATGTSVIVQADLTVLVPPDLDPDLHLRLTELAERESGDTVEVLRLDEARIVKAVQAGWPPGDIVAFLDSVSSVPLADPVVRLVHDAAGRADRVRLVNATTVVIIDDPADLKLACSVRSARLHPVAANVAVSPLAIDKVRQALDRKGLAPTVTGAGPEPPPARSALDDAAELRARAERSRATAARFGRDPDRTLASRLDRMADELSDPAKRLGVTGPLATDPHLVLDQLRHV